MPQQVTVPIELIDGRYMIVGTRIPLDSIVDAHASLGLPPEAISEAFPPLTTAAVYGLLAWFHANRELYAEYAARRHTERLELRAADGAHAQASKLKKSLAERMFRYRRKLRAGD